MIIHYYTLHHLARELQTIIGCRLVECFSQEKNSLVFSFSDGSGIFNLQYFGTPERTSLFLNNNFKRAKKNTVNLFESLIGEILQDVNLLDNNRIIQLIFINTSMYVFLFGGSNSNLIAVNSDGIIIDSLKNSTELVGTKLNLPLPNLPHFSQFPKDTRIIEALSKCSINLGRYYAEEVLTSLNFNYKATIDDFEDSDLKQIMNISEEIKEECLNSIKFNILGTEEGNLMSLIPLSKYPEIINSHSSISEAIMIRMVSDIRKKSYSSLFKELTSKLERQRNRLLKNIEIINDEMAVRERAEKYKLFAELLIAHPSPKQKAGIELNTMDYTGSHVKIPLDENLTIVENANKYFSKVRKSKEELNIRKKRLPDLELKLLKIKNTIKMLGEAESYRELESLSNKLKELTGNKTMDTQDNTSTKFREFDIGDGFIVYVGKNASNNDELTMKFAKPNDLWFHARGSGGSHVVLRTNKEQKIPKNILHKAASIAAYYSQARKAKYVPVAYTYKKYVRKPKGANVGSVIISKEEVIMVEPGIPSVSE